MEAVQLIKAFPSEKYDRPPKPFLRVSEFYYDTIQGEGINIGHPAAFLRLQGCALNCSWCDTSEVWRTGNPYTIEELLDLIEDSGLLEALRAGQHLVVTGGSPLLQQQSLYEFFHDFVERFNFTPYIEIETECIILPEFKLVEYIACWNASPKLQSSGVPIYTRYVPNVIKYTSVLPNSWFKFVITNEEDWKEIKALFLDPELIEREQIILMPEGATREELKRNTERVITIAVREGVLYRSREHIVLWDKSTGV